MLANSKFKFVVKNLINDCVLSPQISVTCFLEVPHSYFSTNSYNIEIGDSLHLSANSILMNGTLEWFLDPTSNIQSSVSNDLVVYYNSTGAKSIMLITTSVHGCVDTLIRTINVIPYVTHASCFYTQLTGFGKFSVKSIVHDNDDNLYTLSDVEADSIFGTGHQNNSFLEIYNRTQQFASLVKFNSKGTPVWSARVAVPAIGSSVLSVEADDYGNTYISVPVARVNNADTVFIYSSDLSVIKERITTDKTFVIKFDINGKHVWHNVLQDRRDIVFEVDTLNNLYTGDGNLLSYLDPNGNLIWTRDFHVNGTGVLDMEIDSLNHCWILGAAYGSAIRVIEMTSSDSLLQFTGPAIGSSAVFPRYMSLGPGGTIVITGTFINDVSFQGNYYYSKRHTDYFLICDRNANPISFHPFEVDSTIYQTSGLCGFDIKGNDLLLYGTCGPGGYIKSPGQLMLSFQDPFIFLYHKNLSTNQEDFIPVQFINGGLGYNVPLEFENNSMELTMGMPFENDFNFGSDHIVPLASNSRLETFIVTGDLSCLFSGGFTTNIDKPVSIAVNNLLIAPNPSSDLSGNLIIYSNKTEQGIISVYNNLGKIIKTVQMMITKGNNEIPLNDLLPQSYNGNYVVSIRTVSSAGTVTGTIIK